MRGDCTEEKSLCAFCNKYGHQLVFCFIMKNQIKENKLKAKEKDETNEKDNNQESKITKVPPKPNKKPGNGKTPYRNFNYNNNREFK